MPLAPVLPTDPDAYRRYAPAALLRFRRYSRHCAGLGLRGQYQHDPSKGIYEVRGHRFRGGVLGTVAGGEFMPAHLRTDIPAGAGALAAELAQLWPHPMLQEPVTEVSGDALQLLLSAPVYVGLCDTTLVVPNGPGTMLWGLAAGQVTTPATLGDLFRSLQQLPSDLSRDELEAMVPHVGLPVERKTDSMTFRQGEHWLQIDLDGQGNFSGASCDLSAEALFDLPLDPEDWVVVRDILPLVVLIGGQAGTGMTELHVQVFSGFMQLSEESCELVALISHWGRPRLGDIFGRANAPDFDPVGRLHQGMKLLEEHVAPWQLARLAEMLGRLGHALLTASPEADEHVLKSRWSALQVALAWALPPE